MDLRNSRPRSAKCAAHGIGISSFTEIVGAGPSKDFDIIGIKMFDSCGDPGPPEPARSSPASSGGQGHETTFAQIIAEELWFPGCDMKIEEGDTDTAPYGLARTLAVHAGRRRGHRRRLAQDPGQGPAHRRASARASKDDLERKPGKFSVKGSPTGSRRSRRSLRGVHQSRGWDKDSGGQLSRPRQPDLPVRDVHLVVDIDKGPATSTSVASRRSMTGNIINPMM